MGQALGLLGVQRPAGVGRPREQREPQPPPARGDSSSLLRKKRDSVEALRGGVSQASLLPPSPSRFHPCPPPPLKGCLSAVPAPWRPAAEYTSACAASSRLLCKVLAELALSSTPPPSFSFLACLLSERWDSITGLTFRFYLFYFLSTLFSELFFLFHWFSWGDPGGHGQVTLAPGAQSSGASLGCSVLATVLQRLHREGTECPFQGRPRKPATPGSVCSL